MLIPSKIHKHYEQLLFQPLYFSLFEVYFASIEVLLSSSDYSYILKWKTFWSNPRAYQQMNSQKNTIKMGSIKPPHPILSHVSPNISIACFCVVTVALSWSFTQIFPRFKNFLHMIQFRNCRYLWDFWNLARPISCHIWLE